MGQTLYLMVGYPGAGKTTTAQILAGLTGATHLSSDTVRLELFPSPTFTEAEHKAVYDELDRRAEELLSAGKSVVYDANLNRREHRDEKYALAKRTGAKVLALWVQTPRELARERAVIRGHHHLVPRDETFETMFDRVASAIEEPTPDEPVVKLDGKHVTNDVVQTVLAHVG